MPFVLVPLQGSPAGESSRPVSTAPSQSPLRGQTAVGASKTQPRTASHVCDHDYCLFADSCRRQAAAAAQFPSQPGWEGAVPEGKAPEQPPAPSRRAVPPSGPAAASAARLSARCPAVPSARHRGSGARPLQPGPSSCPGGTGRPSPGPLPAVAPARRPRAALPPQRRPRPRHFRRGAASLGTRCGRGNGKAKVIPRAPGMAGGTSL